MATKARTANRAFLQPPIMGVDFRIPIAAMPPEYSPFMMNYETVNGRLTKRDPHSKLFALVGNPGDLPFVIPVPNSSIVISVTPNKTENSAGAASTTTPTTVSNASDWIYFNNTILVAGNGVVYQLNPTTLAWTSGLTFTPVLGAGFRKPIVQYRNRVYVGDGATLYYGGIDAILGAMTAFPLGSLVNGNGLMAAGVLNLSDGFSPQQFLVLVSQLGEVLIYSGSYPAATDWYLAHKFKVDIPVLAASYFAFPIELIEVQNDLLLSPKLGPQIYSIRQLIKDRGTSEAVFIEATRPLYQQSKLYNNPPSTPLGFMGYKSVAYAPRLNSLIIYTSLSIEANYIFDSWVTGLPLPGFSQGHVTYGNLYSWITKIDLTTGASVLHTTINGVLVSGFGQLRTRDGDIYLATNDAIIKLLDSTAINRFKDWSITAADYVAYPALCVLAPPTALGYRNKALKHFLMYSNLSASHTFTYGIKKDFDISYATQNTFTTTDTTGLTHKSVLNGFGVAQSHVISFVESSSHTSPFEFQGADILYAEGGEF